ncbi:MULTISPECIES: carbamoyltransferase family protein [Niastella]|uniref:Carbamoyltransferase n=1 Tax=Niastella soli TaxID=2821487 RepID=A0ABS3YWP4_9BACT|nr:carbamoyltransferase [Niastella soli]MBO9202356.1 carbamoyltransferase [Niastella soli]
MNKMSEKAAPKTILGISAFYHDSAAAIIEDGNIIAAAQEERFTRKKHDAAFPSNAVKFCLEYAGRSLHEIDAIVFYDKPLLKFERLLETYYAFAPKGWKSFMMAMPVWIKEKLFLKKNIREALNSIEKIDKKKVRLLFTEHHLSHAASAFYASPFDKAAILTIDGVGEWATASIGIGDGNKITILKELHFPHSLGLLYSSFTYYCGFKVNSGEYKLMGLAPYGNPGSEQVKRFKGIITRQLVDVKADGSIFLNQEYFSYATGDRMVYDNKWQTLFGFPRRQQETPLEQHHCDLALAIQEVTEEIVLNLAREAKKLTGATALCMAGGVALNCVANGKLDDARIFNQLFIQPAAGDAGGALGAALAAHHIYFDGERKVPATDMDNLQGSYLGPEYSSLEILAVARKYGAPYTQFQEEEALLNETARLIAEKNIIGWHQGRMEFGPRALGARSILADARDPQMQKKLNEQIKFRESFRPFAPVVLAEEVASYFEYEGASPYMLLVKPIKKERQLPYPPGYEHKGLLDKLYFQRSNLPAITHIDHSARIQTVHKETNPRFWKLLHAFKRQTGCAVMINTSFNVRGEPVVNTPEEAYRCFMRTGMDYLIMGNFIFCKKDQPEWQERSDWKREFTLD